MSFIRVLKQALYNQIDTQTKNVYRHGSEKEDEPLCEAVVGWNTKEPEKLSLILWNGERYAISIQKA